MSDSSVPSWLIPDRVYDVLKWLALIVLPVLSVFVQNVGNAAGWDGTWITVTVLSSLGVLIGGIIGISQVHAMVADK